MGATLLRTRTVALKERPNVWVTVTLLRIGNPLRAGGYRGYRVEAHVFHALEHLEGPCLQRTSFKGRQEAEAQAYDLWCRYKPAEHGPLNRYSTDRAHKRIEPNERNEPAPSYRKHPRLSSAGRMEAIKGRATAPEADEAATKAMDELINYLND